MCKQSFYLRIVIYLMGCTTFFNHYNIFFFFSLQASFFIAYVVTSWTSLSSELTRLITLIGDWMGRNCCRCVDNEFHSPSIPYHSEIPRILLFVLLGLAYFILAPLILPFVLVFFCIGYIIYRNQVSKTPFMTSIQV